MDRAGQAFWDTKWKGSPLPPPVDPTDHSLGNTQKLCFHELFERELAALPQGARILEVGGARSPWLPYFAIQHKLNVSGLDYSPDGCEQARAILAQAGVEGDIVLGDMFDPPTEMVGRFDAVVSFGLVEHFEDTAAAHKALARFLVPGGMLITVIPNMGRSFVGWLQKALDRKIYDVHIPLDREQLLAANLHANLSVSSCSYFMTWNWSVIDISDWRNPSALHIARRAQSATNKVLWQLERWGLRLPPNRLTSPSIVAIARTATPAMATPPIHEPLARSDEVLQSHETRG